MTLMELFIYLFLLSVTVTVPVFCRLERSKDKEEFFSLCGEMV